MVILLEKKFYLVFIGFLLTIILFMGIIILGILSMFFHFGDLIPFEYIKYFVKILPGPIYTDIILLYAITIGVYYIHHFIFPYFSKTWFFFHKIIRRNSNYGFIKVGAKVVFSKLFIRAFYVGLFAFSITTLISSFSGAYLFRAGLPIINMDVLFTCEDIFLGTFFLTPISIILFFPLWQMEDSGFVSFRHIPENRRTPEIEGVHSIFYRILKGYAGLSTIISLAYYIYNAFDAVGWDFKSPAILTPLILVFLPFLVMGLIFVPILLHEKYVMKNTSRLRKSVKELKTIEIPKFEDTVIEK